MNQIVQTWIFFILAFGGMILVHEIGHFVAARLVKIEVEEFGIGFPTPGALTMFTWKGTRFTFNWLPIGGFVRPKGENDPNVEGGMASATPWNRFFFFSAGPLMNLLVAVIFISIIIAQTGGIITTPGEKVYVREIVITEVSSNSPAETAGLKAGDIILAANGTKLNNEDDASSLIKASADTPILFTILRNGEQIELTITPRMNTQVGRPMIGISMCGGCKFKPITSISENIQYSLKMTGAQIYGLVTLPVRLIQGTIPSEQGRLIGLKGIFDIMRQGVANDAEASQAQSTSATSNPYNKPVSKLSIIVTLSISLGVFNLFPFPALDGGRIIFLLPELIFRRRVSPQLENLVHGIGMTFLLLLMLYINVRDFIDPVITSFP